MTVKKIFLKAFNAEADESKALFLLLGMGFFMGICLANLQVGASALFLNSLSAEQVEQQLPLAMICSGCLGIVATAIYNYFQNRTSFKALGLGALLAVLTVILVIVLAFRYFDNATPVYFLAFTSIVPINFIVLLVFWSAFNVLFSVRQAKRIIGSIDTGQLAASILAFFTIPVLIGYFAEEELLFVSLVAIVAQMVLFLFIADQSLKQNRSVHKMSISYKGMIQNRYLVLMALFVIISMVAINFVDYSFLHVTTTRFGERELVKFLSLFEGTVVIFSFLFQTFVTDRIISMYGLKVALLINPVLIAIFTALAIPVGYYFGYTEEAGGLIIFFFITITMSRLFSFSLKDALDSPAFKLYFLPVDSRIRLDVQTKIEGVMTAFATLAAGISIYLIYHVEVFTLINISVFTLPVLFLWFFITVKMHAHYRNTLRATLAGNRKKFNTPSSYHQYTVSTILENEIAAGDDNRAIRGLRLLQHMEPNLFEQLVDKPSRNIPPRVLNAFRAEPVRLTPPVNTPSGDLVPAVPVERDENEWGTVAPEKLEKLSRSKKPHDRVLAAKLLRRATSSESVFIIMELLKDTNEEVMAEVMMTARKTSPPQAWRLLVEMLRDAKFGNMAAAALAKAGDPALHLLNFAFYQSEQNNLVKSKIIRILTRIGTPKAIALLLEKVNDVDREMARHVLRALCHLNYKVSNSEVNRLTQQLKNEIGMTLRHLAALNELPDEHHFGLLREAIEEATEENYEAIYMYLSVLYDPTSVRLVRKNIESGSSEDVAFALELCDLFVTGELKTMLFPLLDHIPVSEKVNRLQEFFPMEKHTVIQTLSYLLNRDNNEVNIWTKACTIHGLTYVRDFRASHGLIAQLFHEDPLIREVAGWAMYVKDRERLEEVRKRLPAEHGHRLYEMINNKLRQNEQGHSFFMQFDIILLLKKIPIFDCVKGIQLRQLVDKISTHYLNAGEMLNFQTPQNAEYIGIVGAGTVLARSHNARERVLKKYAVYKNLPGLEGKTGDWSITAPEKATVFHIAAHDLYNVMSENHELVKGFLKDAADAPALRAEA